jgi:hypothetical protein
VLSLESRTILFIEVFALAVIIRACVFRTGNLINLCVT